VNVIYNCDQNIERNPMDRLFKTIFSGETLMKNLTLLSAAVVMFSAVAIGCSTDGTSSFCRTGALFPTSRSPQYDKEKVYYTDSIVRRGSNCDPCEPVHPCSPCEPVCNPCDNADCSRPPVVHGPISGHVGG
jgi:hypothetical protein